MGRSATSLAVRGTSAPYGPRSVRELGGSGVSRGHRAAGSHHQHQRVIKQAVLTMAVVKTPNGATLRRGVQGPGIPRRPSGAHAAATTIAHPGPAPLSHEGSKT